MLTPVTILALVGALGAPGLTGRLATGTAQPREAVVAVVQPLHGAAGTAGALRPAVYDPSGPGAARLVLVGHRKHEKHKHRKHRHDRYERGKGHKRHHHHHHRDQYSYSYYEVPAAVPPVYGGLPAFSMPCGARELTGILLGGATGGLLGSQIGGGTGQLAAVAAGTLAGAFFGREIGVSLDQGDFACVQSAVQQAHGAPIGTPIVWTDPVTGYEGTVIPVREGTTQAGRYCREYQATVIVGGRSERGYGTACRQPDGSWEIVR